MPEASHFPGLDTMTCLAAVTEEGLMAVHVTGATPYGRVEYSVLHARDPRHTALVLSMTGHAPSCFGMEGGITTMEERGVLRMAAQALEVRHTSERDVARLTVPGDLSMRRSERAWRADPSHTVEPGHTPDDGACEDGVLGLWEYQHPPLPQQHGSEHTHPTQEPPGY